MPEACIRPGRDSDAAAFIALIGDCWAEYPGVVFDLDGEVPELKSLASYYAAKGGALWAAEADRAVVGMVAAAPLPGEDGWEITRMYVARAWRGTGLARRLLDAAEARARAAGALRALLWSDTRFRAAHRFYEKHSYVRVGPIRVLDDISKSLEFRYLKPLAGLVVEVVDAPAAASAEPLLGAILAEAVSAGCALGFHAPLDAHRARTLFRDVTKAVATGQRLLLLAWRDGLIIGSVDLDFARAETELNLARVERLMVATDQSDEAVERELVAAAERAAERSNRRLLVASVRAEGLAERVLLGAGWTRLGSIPGSMTDAAGAVSDVAVWWRALG